jgi:hypothetical protein
MQYNEGLKSGGAGYFFRRKGSKGQTSAFEGGIRKALVKTGSLCALGIFSEESFNLEKTTE